MKNMTTLKIARQQTAVQEESKATAAKAPDNITQRIRMVFAGERETPYTEDELENFAQEQGISRQDFTKRWIIKEGQSYYDWKTETFIEAVCPLRPLAPEFSERVDQYLRLLGGKQTQTLLDWVSVVTKLDEPCAALFLHGVPGSGKTLLANGLARLWRKGEATDINQVLGSAFNEALMNCPLILADEQLPSFIKKEGSTAELRALIQGTQRRVTRQFKSAITLKGAVRLIITANNRNLFNIRDALSNEDIVAVRDRILYLYAGQASKDYLSALTQAERKEMVLGDEIAKHALWLRDIHEPQNEDRFMVPGQDSSFHQSERLNNDPESLIRIEDGQLLVTAPALTDFWKTYDGTERKPPRYSSIFWLEQLEQFPKRRRLGESVVECLKSELEAQIKKRTTINPKQGKSQ